MTARVRLSKTRYVKGLRCPLALYLDVHHRELATPMDPVQQARLEVGHRIGALAQARYPDGILVAEDNLHHDDAVATTSRLLSSGEPTLFEAAFTYDDVKVRVDILHRSDRGTFELIEVKSTTRFDPARHLADVAIQLYVVEHSGLPVDRVILMHLDRFYVHPGGPYDPFRILATTDVTTDARSFLERIPSDLVRLKDTLSATEPPCPPDSVDCARPYRCEFHEWCHRDDPVPDLSAPLRLDPAVLSRLEDLAFPLHFVDFETVNPALPVFPGTSPYEPVCVQFSVHTLFQDGRVTHSEHLVETTDRDPSPDFASRLLEVLGTEGTFIHYSPYEITRLTEIAVKHPSVRQQLIERIPALYDRVAEKLATADHGASGPLERPTRQGLVPFDLGARVVRDGCAHPVLGERGWSIKQAVQVLTPSLPTYEGLAIKSGDEAMLATLEMLDPATPQERARHLRADLLAYCEHDTLAMLEIYRSLTGALRTG